MEPFYKNLFEIDLLDISQNINQTIKEQITNFNINGDDVSVNLNINQGMFIDTYEEVFNTKSIIINFHDKEGKVVLQINLEVAFKNFQSLEGDYISSNELLSFTAYFQIKKMKVIEGDKAIKVNPNK